MPSAACPLTARASVCDCIALVRARALAAGLGLSFAIRVFRATRALQQGAEEGKKGQEVMRTHAFAQDAHVCNHACVCAGSAGVLRGKPNTRKARCRYLSFYLSVCLSIYIYCVMHTHTHTQTHKHTCRPLPGGRCCEWLRSQAASATPSSRS